MASDPESRTAPSSAPPPRTRRRRRTRIALAVAGGVVAVIVIAAVATPWPSAMIIRGVFSRGGADQVAIMNRHQLEVPLTERLDVAYGASAEEKLDVFSPAAADGPLPTVVWIHGGAWISGSKADVAPYLRILAAHGYTAVGLNYTRGPEAQYPTAVTQLNAALGYLTAHAAELRIDPARIVLAGDSAGAQLASQLAALITNGAYAQQLGILPALEPDQLVGVILQCGVYDLSALAEVNGIVGWGFRAAMWAYTGQRSWADSPAADTMSTIDFVTGAFPATFISGGNGDGLTGPQSLPMERRLTDLGVDVTALFWPDDHEPSLPHEYQFNLDLADARAALEQTLAFLAVQTGP